MNGLLPLNDELADLLESLCLEELSTTDAARLEELVSSDPECCRQYIVFMQMHALAERFAGKWQADSSSECDEGVAQPIPAFMDESAVSRQSIPPLSIALDQLPTIHYPLSTSSVGGWAFSYIVASVVLCLMLLGGWAYKISSFDKTAEVSPPKSSREINSQFVSVGQVTGMKECRWTEGSSGTMVGASVPLGREYTLVSGLMEITYASGARVILEGPCMYTVDSDAGGYLAVGRLTARVEGRGKSDERRGLAASAAGAKPQVASPQSPAPLFAVRTPTAVVTDLGTEFGVEVGNDGATISHVFRGSVRVQALGNRQLDIVLKANQSVRVEKKNNVIETRLLSGGKSGEVPKFVRRLYEPPKLLDLLDVVAGGNGLGRRRGCGIDPTSGMVDPIYLRGSRFTDRKYLPVIWNNIIDGVFVPNGGAEAAKLDSAGHHFEGFPRTSGNAWGTIWAREAEVKPNLRATDGRFWVQSMGYDPRFMPDKRGVLIMHPNAGITFDLDAMRRAHSNAAITRFLANAGMVDAHSLFPENINGRADLWIFVDGRLRMKRLDLKPEDGVVAVDEELGPNDRFLTLVTTDGGNGHSNDWIVFGDPVLLISQTAKNQPVDDGADTVRP